MSERHSRQGFLGERAESVFRVARVGIVGLGGGGSHVVQQLAHLGFENFALFDPDRVEHSNLNRLVGATEEDAKNASRKIDVAERVIRGLAPSATIVSRPTRWQESADELHVCDVVVGCLDSMKDRSELEITARRYLIPYVDIGMTVICVGDEAPEMSGQVILTTPDGPCMRCLNFITDADLHREGQRYGDAGIRPQVVWANGLLASAAVGLVVGLLTNWTRRAPVVEYLSLQGNTSQLVRHPRLDLLKSTTTCRHFACSDIGAVRTTLL